MRAFRPYVSQLQELLERSVRSGLDPAIRADVNAALDGQPSAELRRQVPIDALRECGAFFTGSALARMAIRVAGLRLTPRARILDPACGAGDLLVAIAARFPCSSDLRTTLFDWGRRVLALDVQPEFVRATKLRLALAAVQRHKAVFGTVMPNLDDAFPGIGSGSSLDEQRLYEEASHILINPPFTPVDAPENCAWGEGKVNAAALFMDACVMQAKPGTRIIAILPDVLRSGTRYAKWRRLFEEKVDLQKIQLVGQFDRHTDVDVFVAIGELKNRLQRDHTVAWVRKTQNTGNRLADGFRISVGAVVAYRDPHEGHWFPFVQARDLPSWSVVSDFHHHRRFKGKTVQPPFVVVRRTSRPGDKHRAVGTLIKGKRRIAVENHLLVLQPKDGRVATCERLLAVLKNADSNEFLDERIRCRHLTVSALLDLPWSTR